MTATAEPVRPAAVDAQRWPDVARVPRSRVRGPVARALALRAFARLPIRVHTPQGPLPSGGGPRSPRLDLHRPDDFFRRVASGGLIGFGESYMAGDWDSPDLVALLTAFGDGFADLVPRPLQPLRALALPTQPSAERNTRGGARSNIHRHYDLSNELFGLFLDETMSYSAALFDGGPAEDRADLAAAQRRKNDRLLDRTGVGAGTRLLEVGTGWGELAISAARRGADVVSVTLSEEQCDLARARVAAAGLADRVDVRVADYRDVTGQYDAIVSVEMVEAVGERYWPVYFTTLDRLVVPGGRIGLQAITMDHARMRATRSAYTWMHKYVFPGGLIPSVRAIEEQVRSRTALRVVDRLAFGGDYAATLRLWRAAFTAGQEQTAALGFDGVFHRMWSFYLAYSEAGFRSGLIDVEQIILERA